eukprot:4079161-Amphidinium_carterae.1
MLLEHHDAAGYPMPGCGQSVYRAELHAILAAVRSTPTELDLFRMRAHQLKLRRLPVASKDDAIKLWEVVSHFEWLRLHFLLACRTYPLQTH